MNSYRLLPILGLTVALVASACSPGVGGRFGELHRLAKSCPKAKQVAG